MGGEAFVGAPPDARRRTAAGPANIDFEITAENFYDRWHASLLPVFRDALMFREPRVSRRQIRAARLIEKSTDYVRNTNTALLGDSV
jgi:hypothetical protein